MKAPKCKGLNICFRKHSRYNYLILNDLKVTAVNFRSLRLWRLWRPQKLRGFSALKEIFQPTFQRRINVVSTLWINVKITLIRRWKWNKIRRRIFNVVQRWYNVNARRWKNVETTLHNVETMLRNVGITLIQRFELASTLVETILNPIGLVMIMDLQTHKYFLFF